MAEIKLQLYNSNPISPTALLTWKPVATIPSGAPISILNYVVSIFTDEAARNSVYSGATPIAQLQIPAGLLARDVSYYVVITENYFINSGQQNGQQGSIVSNAQQIITTADDYIIEFTCNPTYVASNTRVAYVTVSWNFTTADFAKLTSAHIEPSDAFTDSSVNFAKDFKVAQVDVTTMFILRAYFSDGTSAYRKAIVTLDNKPAAIVPGEFSSDDLQPGDAYVELGERYVVTIQPTKMRDVTLFFNFNINNTLYSVPVSDNILLLGKSTPLGISVIGQYVNAFTLDYKRGVNSSISFIGTTEEGKILSQNVENFKFVNLKPVPVGGGNGTSGIINPLI